MNKVLYHFSNCSKSRCTLLAYTLMMPTIIIMTSLVMYPIAATFIFSLRKMKLSSPQDNTFVGLDNYMAILTSPSFWFSLQNTLFIMILVVILCTIFGMILALMLNFDVKINNIFIAIAILPWALPPVVNAILWRWIFHSGYGLLNKVLINMNIISEPVNWLSNRYYLLIILAIVVAWRNIPFATIVLLSAIKTIPKSIYEAASLDGAGESGSFFYITLPILIPTLGVVLTFTSINAINVFDEVISLSGYSNIGKTILVENYMITFSFLDFGMGTALSYIIMLMSSLVALIYIKSLSKKVNYY